MKSILQNTSTKNIFAKTISSLLAVAIYTVTNAGVIIGGGTPTAISADKAVNANNPAYSILDKIVIAECESGDFKAGNGKMQSLILTAPEGWSFNPGAARINSNKYSDIKSLSFSVNKTTITIRFIVTGNTHKDYLTISEIQVISADGANLGAPSFIHRSKINGGTAQIAGIISTENTDGTGGTSFASLFQIGGAAAKLVFTSKPGPAIVGVAFDEQPVVVTQDQFGNATAVGLGEIQIVKIRLSAGTGELSGTIQLNIGTTGGNGMIACSNLLINTTGTKKLMASTTNLSFAVTNEFKVVEPEKETSISADDNPDWICFNSTSIAGTSPIVVV